MKLVVSREEARAFDRSCEARGIPGVLLMENAGRSAADHLSRWKRKVPVRWMILCGPGNNGGDGFVVARHLHANGTTALRVLVFTDPKLLRGDARVMFDAMCGEGIEPEILSPELSGASFTKRLSAKKALGPAAEEVIVDALFGTGLSRPLEPWCVRLVEWVRERRAAGATVVSLDIPSGLDANLGTQAGASIGADKTITFGHLKRGLLTPMGRSCAGEIVVASLGVSPTSGTPPSCAALEARDVSAMLEGKSDAGSRGARAHKYTRGHVWIVGGSPGKMGALHLAARGAFRAGAGAVTAATWPTSSNASVRGFPEIMTATIPPDDPEPFVKALKARATSVVIGPGLGTDARARLLTSAILRHYAGPVLLDADALTILGDQLRDDPDFFRKVPEGQSRAVLPHNKEGSRLLGVEVEAIESDRYGSVASIAERTRGVALLKGAHSLVTAHGAHGSGKSKSPLPLLRGGKNVRTFVMPVGSPLLGVAGSGDVLAGIAGAFATRLPILEAVLVAGFLHASAGESLASKRRKGGLLAHEIADEASSLLAAMHSACP